MEYLKIKSIKVIQERQTVYNFHVPTYESYIANGFVTHNCYVARHRAFGNPLEKYTNLLEIYQTTVDHHSTLGVKTPNQCDPEFWTYDIGESTDCLLPDNINETNFFVQAYVNNSEIKPSFATKICQLSKLMDCPIPRRARIRFSLMPQRISDWVEVGTSQIHKRIEAIDIAYSKGYEVHINFSPVILYEGWEEDYKQLFLDVKNNVSKEVLKQLKAEVIFLTHSYELSEVNKLWNPEAETLLAVPHIQEYKTTQRGDSSVVRYKSFTVKANAIRTFTSILSENLPECQIRYIF